MIRWENSHFFINQSKFQIITKLAEMYTFKCEDGYVIAKTRRYIDKYIELFSNNTNIKYIFELGILRGGSTVFLAEFFNPKKLVAVEYNNKPVDALVKFIAQSGKFESVKPYYGVNQADTAKLEKIVADEYRGEALDLIIDDASHMLEETRASFNCLFPKLRANGMYVIEDWAWAHNKAISDAIKGTNPLVGKDSMANLIIEIQLAAVAAPGLIDEVIVNDAFVVVRKGSQIAPAFFDVSDYGITMDKKTTGTIFIR